MKNAFCNIVCLDRLKARPTKKDVTSLLILTAIIVALFAVPTAAFASSNMREDNGPLPTASVTPTSSNGSSQDPWISIHMLDKTHGWALTPHLVLKTADGGLHWQNVIPANAFT